MASRLKSLRKDQVSYALVVLFLFLAIYALFFRVNRKDYDYAKVNPAFAAYVSGFTAGTISRAEPIRLQFTTAITADTRKKNIAELFEFEPAIKGETRWLDSVTVEFRPEKWLPSGRLYKVRFNLEDILPVPDSLAVFPFMFRTIAQSFEVSGSYLEATDPQQMAYQRLNADLQMADVESSALVEKLLTATYNGKNYPVRWEHQAQGTVHRVLVDSLPRLESAGKLRLSWNGDALGIKKSGADEFEIPALGDFKVTQVLAVNEDEQYISIYFSDPLLAVQQLEGLVQLADSSGGELRFTVERNQIRVYPQRRLTGSQSVTISPGILNAMSYKMPEGHTAAVVFEDLKPSVNIVGSGVIIPGSDRIMLPFEATSLKAVDVTITKVFENNVLQFLQVNSLDGNDEFYRVGRKLAKTTIRLDDNKLTDLHKTNRFGLELSKIIKPEPGAVYNVKFSFKKEYALYRCTGEEEVDGEEGNFERLDNEEWVGESSEDAYWDWSSDYYGSYNWEERDNPCSNSYYNSNRWTSRNVLASDLGLIAKKGTGNTFFCSVTSILSTQPMANVTLELYDFQRQLLASGRSDANGWLNMKTDSRPFLLVAKNGNQRGYLRIDDGSSLSVSNFDVSGEVVQKGIKGFLYGERGVWRPGDDIYLTFVLDDSENRLPAGHPVSFEFFNPQGQLYKRIINNQPLNGFYTFKTGTDRDAPTGNWQARIKVGGAVFTKNIRIETVMPNRLKIKLDFGKPYLTKSDIVKTTLEARWLHGATAQNLRTTIDVALSRSETTFKNYKDFIFDDPTRNFQSENKTWVDRNLDEDGKIEISEELAVESKAGGVLNASFLAKVYEPGGNFSIDQFTIPYYPYDNLLGIKAPAGEKWSGMIVTDTNHRISIVNVTPDGNLLKGKKNVEVRLYKVDWRWWWERGEEDLQNYAESNYHQPIQTDNVTLVDGKASWTLRVNAPEWGRYLIRVIDPESGHATGTTVYMDWPGWYSRDRRDNPSQATMLSFTSSKNQYKVGEEAVLTIPSGSAGRALVSVENGSRVVQTYWVEAKKGQTRFSFKVTRDMLPNVFVNVTLLQPHSQTENDLPIRMYGMVSLAIEDPATVLKPVLTTPAVLRPEKAATVQVAESNGKAMTYTLAIVDEGLLDLTRFKTPDPHGAFYAREALGVKTWDLYDHVLGAYGVELDRILSIGGDEGKRLNAGAVKANRFKPVVQFMGPFALPAGKTASHTVKLPPYIGSVRIMVIAGQNSAYGFAEKAVPVRNPLMVLGTMPRVLGPGESVKFPVTVFAMEKHVKNVSIEIVPNEFLTAAGGLKKSLTFSKTGEQMVDFDLKVRSQLGVAKVRVIARSGNEKAEYEVELDVRNPNPYLTTVHESVVEPGQGWTKPYLPVGMAGTNTGVLEISVLPPIELGRRLNYLVHYPHGCVEQTTSSVFPQLVLHQLLDLRPEMKKRIEGNIRAGISRLKGFQVSGGGLGYWPGEEGDPWGTTYAGHFMIEAQNQGYSLPVNFLSEWKRFQKKFANNWVYTHYNSDLDQAYRLYTLALAGAPELGAMNRLKEYKNLSIAAAWRLAAAYVLAGHREVGQQLVKSRQLKVDPYKELGYTFGSEDRDHAMILETLILLNRKTEAAQLVKVICEELSRDEWMSTQTTAQCLLAVAKYCGKNTTGNFVQFAYSLNGSAESSFKGQTYFAQVQAPIKGAAAGTVKVRNTSNQLQYVRLILQGQPEVGDTISEASGLNMSISFTTLKGAAINPARLDQGTDFIAEVTVSNPTAHNVYQQMALTQIFPSGWEIVNTRLGSEESFVNTAVPTYQDIRDDRVLTYFNLQPGQISTFRVLLNSSYVGRFYMPSVYCEAMYNNSIRARKAGRWVEVVPRGTGITAQAAP